MPRSLVALGANLGDRQHTLARAVETLRAHPRIAVLRQSSWHETPPIGGPGGQGRFLNAAVSCETVLPAAALHAVLDDIERSLGRTRRERWEARAIDLDLLFYGDEVIATPSLIVPHPRMAFRRFVLEAAVEVAPDMIHPSIGWTVGQLLEHLNTSAEYIALLGLAGSGKSALAAKLASAFGGRCIAQPAADVPVQTPADPPSLVWERQIQFLDRLADLLAGESGRRCEGLAVSDFYFDQCLAYAGIELDDRAFESFFAAWSEARQRVVSPKLLVVLDAPPSSSTGEADRPLASLPRIERLRRELLRLAARPGLGPVLYAGGEDRVAQFEETSAAIAAMR